MEQLTTTFQHHWCVEQQTTKYPLFSKTTSRICQFVVVVLCEFYVRLTLSGIADRFVFFLQAFLLLFSSRCCVGVGGLSPRSVSMGSDLVMLGRPGRMTEKDTDPSLNSVLQDSLPLMYGLRTAVHLFHGVRGSSVSRYFVGVNYLPIKLLLAWVDRSLICVNVVGLWMACSSLCSCSVCVVSSVMELLSSVCV